MLWASTVIAAVVTAGAEPDLRSVLALTFAALAVALLSTALSVPAPSERLAAALGVLRDTPAAPRHCDPDAAGRPRPRAPTTV
ncbi:MAG TPA: DUF6412 domain-containing protein [Candidatus Limnocylindrales bacterium]|nr:DUF6412 domain-containing protein [Candidatus Limnocylindrales bacterium]